MDKGAIVVMLELRAQREEKERNGDVGVLQ